MINGVIGFHDTMGIYRKTVLKDIPSGAAVDLAAMLALATDVYAFINAGVSHYDLMTWTEAAQTPTLVTAVGLNSVKAAITCNYVIGGTQKTVLLWLPNPAAAAIQNVNGQGLRLTTAARDALVAALTASAGFAVDVTDSQILTRGWKKSRSKTHHSIQFVDAGAQKGFMGIPRDLCTSSGALATLTSAIDAAGISGSLVNRSFFLLKQSAAPDQTTAPGLAVHDADSIVFDSVETAAFLKFSYFYSGVKKYERFPLFAIRRSQLDPSIADPVVGSSKFKLQDATGEAIATALTTLYGGQRTLTYVGAVLKGVDIKAK